MRRAAKRDLSEKGIVSLLRQFHMSVYRLDQPVDLLVGYRGQTYLIECKSGHKGYGKALNDNQARFADEWRGNSVVTLHDTIDAYDWAKSIMGYHDV
ncbi:hypothetical protein [Bartonella tamiae]|uniref:hypothetical protein n=1 Tax=Bartonella tamiae TaxID=373638 RepID=UPI00026E77B7|nr:hypothetical protein [Bartonella tamiae]EJF92662.1 hypothetical protein MEG_01832 [Bartonella tamiae Th307]